MCVYIFDFEQMHERVIYAIKGLFDICIYIDRVYGVPIIYIDL